jgi:surfeit locus 1 family protein
VKRWPVLLVSGLGILVLCALGVWQVQRLTEKQQLLAQVEVRAGAPPISLAEALKRAQSGEDISFLRVTAKGHFDHTLELHKQASLKGGPGFEVITPFVSDDGVAVLVDRGAVPEELKLPSSRNESVGPTEITGVIRIHGGGQGVFDPENDAAGNLWYWWDMPAMQAQASFPAEAKPAPFILHALPGGDQPRYPLPSEPDDGIRNNHLQYAITWFSLAAVLLVIAALFLHRQPKA